MHTAKKTNKKIHSYDSKQLKFYPSICEKCNSKISQPFDNAWTSMSDFIAKKKKTEKIELIDLEDIFHGSVSRSMLNVHLFFVKWFGCLIKENSIPIELDSFSGSIMNLTEHPFIYLAINVIKLAYGLV
jgi:hypothetical protein